MNALIILTQTPWWVYAIFAYCIVRGIYALEDREVNIRKSLILPGVFIYMGLDTLIHQYLLFNIHGLTYGIGTLCGIGLGYLLMLTLNISKTDIKLTVLVPGNWYTMVIILMVFSIKYFMGLVFGAHLPIEHHLYTMLTLMFISAVGTGMLIGRTVRYMAVLRTGSSIK